MKICTKCGISQGLKAFNRWAKGKDGYNAQCRKCARERNTQYRAQPGKKEKATQSARTWRRLNREYYLRKTAEYRAGLKAEILSHYARGPLKCTCCDIMNTVFLGIDHIHGNGRQHRLKIRRRGGHSFYLWLKQRGYPKGYQVLCHNCNIAKAVLGICPHMANKVKQPLPGI